MLPEAAANKIGFADYKWVCLHNFVNRLVRRLLERFVKNLRKERVTQMLDKERCVKEQICFDLLYVSCIYFTS